MSESTSEDFSDADSDVSQEEKPTNKKVAENGKRKVLQKKKGQEPDSDDDSTEDDNNELETAPQPVKKRKTLQDYLNEKVNKYKLWPLWV